MNNKKRIDCCARLIREYLRLEYERWGEDFQQLTSDQKKVAAEIKTQYTSDEIRLATQKLAMIAKERRKVSKG